VRFVRALELANICGDRIVLNGFGSAYGELETMAGQALAELGCRAVSANDLLEDDSLEASAFVGSPDRFYALCRSGYASVVSHALLAGGAVFPMIYQSAHMQAVALCDMMSDPLYGPYALRCEVGKAYQILPDVQVDLLQAGGQSAVPCGMVGEVVLGDDTPRRTGTLSAFEQVPHSHREPGLQGWMGFAEQVVELEDQTVSAEDVATLIGEHDEVLGARLVLDGVEDGPVLEVETEAGDWIEPDLAASFERISGFAARVARVTPGRMPNTGRVFARPLTGRAA
jgi:hypothetical protein